MTMKIAFTSDLHGHLPEIEPCDILIIAGDIAKLPGDRDILWSRSWFRKKFFPWVNSIPASKVIMTPGNHDFYLYELYKKNYPYHLQLESWPDKLFMLIDRTINVDGLIIHGTPWVTGLPNWAFNNDTPGMLDFFKKTIPEKCDVLITHAALGIGDTCRVMQHNTRNFLSSYPNIPLTNAIADKEIRYVVNGHIHSGEHEPIVQNGTTFFNASYINENYVPAYPVKYLDI